MQTMFKTSELIDMARNIERQALEYGEWAGGGRYRHIDEQEFEYWNERLHALIAVHCHFDYERLWEKEDIWFGLRFEYAEVWDGTDDAGWYMEESDIAIMQDYFDKRWRAVA